jgi:hypothetical protein
MGSIVSTCGLSNLPFENRMRGKMFLFKMDTSKYASFGRNLYPTDGWLYLVGPVGITMGDYGIPSIEIDPEDMPKMEVLTDLVFSQFGKDTDTKSVQWLLDFIDGSNDKFDSNYSHFQYSNIFLDKKVPMTPFIPYYVRHDIWEGFVEPFRSAVARTCQREFEEKDARIKRSIEFWGSNCEGESYRFGSVYDQIHKLDMDVSKEDMTQCHMLYHAMLSLKKSITTHGFFGQDLEYMYKHQDKMADLIKKACLDYKNYMDDSENR